MRVLVDVAEAGDQLEALIERARRGNERPVTATGGAGIDAAWDLAREGRGTASGATSEHGALYDEAGAPD